MCVCVCVCIYIYVCVYECVHIYLCVCMCVYVCVYIYWCVCVCVCVYLLYHPPVIQSPVHILHMLQDTLVVFTLKSLTLQRSTTSIATRVAGGIF